MSEATSAKTQTEKYIMFASSRLEYKTLSDAAGSQHCCTALHACSLNVVCQTSALI